MTAAVGCPTQAHSRVHGAVETGQMAQVSGKN